MRIFASKIARPCTDIDDVLREINQRLRKLEKSNSEKNEEIDVRIVSMVRKISRYTI